MAALSGSVTMGLKAPVVGVKQSRAVRTAAMPARANLGSSFTKGAGKSFEGQKLSLGVVASTGRSKGSRCVTSMAAKIAGYIKLAIEAGKANPAPPIGPALGAKVRALIHANFDVVAVVLGVFFSRLHSHRQDM